MASMASPTQFIFATQSAPPNQYSTPFLPTLASHLVQVTGNKPKPLIAMDECRYCHQKGHWKHACPKHVQPKGRNASQFIMSLC